MKKLPMWLQMVISMALAVIVGLIFVAANIDEGNWLYSFFAFISNVFIRLINMLVVPLVVTSLIVGVAGLKDPLKLGSIGWKTIVYFISTTFCAALIGLILVNIFHPGNGFTIPSDIKAPDSNKLTSLSDTFLNMIPTNPIQALTQTSILQIIFFSIFIGIAMVFLGEKAKPAYNFFEACFEIMMKITAWIMALAPYGVFALIVKTIADNGTTVFAPLAKYMFVILLGLFLHLCIVYFSLIKTLGKMNPITFMRGVFPAWLIAFSTASSNATLPVSLRSVENNLGVSNRVSSFVLPLGATVNMDGTALYEGVAALFIAQAYGIHLSIGAQIIILLTASLAAIGAAGIPGAGLITMVLVLNAVNLPVEGIGLILAVDRLLDMFRTSINVLGDCTGSVVVARREGEIEEGTEQIA
ncbi:sodium:dicarboxylate symporter [Pullulanibacillus camelliae]|uniref:Sodium:dicarboxylate symporter n=1 Tax=Pullulanibacillus camelliae TaxID=1707096 RepID=A0A8J2YI62_9BACL|nr:dicarboxylate/amino acid:cation symporter [Pullulanibacillus camelliae]GGE44643.1 sodium:dicarboxylate symporter [Pullulanibacillus camelliae]